MCGQTTVYMVQINDFYTILTSEKLRNWVKVNWKANPTSGTI